MKQHGKGETGIRRRRGADLKRQRAGTLFRLWNELGALRREAERLQEAELVHLLSVTQLLIEDRAQASVPALAGFDERPGALAN
ncbi:MAG: hypothetical protein U1E23_04880 [Reyranellaceae bacterium]